MPTVYETAVRFFVRHSVLEANVQNLVAEAIRQPGSVSLWLTTSMYDGHFNLFRFLSLCDLRSIPRSTIVICTKTRAICRFRIIRFF